MVGGANCHKEDRSAGTAKKVTLILKAIAVWEGLLSFEPNNAEIKKAVNTAKTQLDGIKKK
jgi:hypothetical protein